MKTAFEDLCRRVYDFVALGRVCYHRSEYISAMDYPSVALKLSKAKKNKPNSLVEAKIIPLTWLSYITTWVTINRLRSIMNKPYPYNQKLIRG